MSRAAFLTKLHEVAPELLPFVRVFYGRPSTYSWWDDQGRCREVKQGEGCEQGDPLAPALFAPGQHDALHRAASTLHPDDSLVAFLDDLYLTTTPSSPLEEAPRRFSASAWPSMSLSYFRHGCTRPAFQRVKQQPRSSAAAGWTLRLGLSSFGAEWQLLAPLGCRSPRSLPGSLVISGQGRKTSRAGCWRSFGQPRPPNTVFGPSPSFTNFVYSFDGTPRCHLCPRQTPAASAPGCRKASLPLHLDLRSGPFCLEGLGSALASRHLRPLAPFGAAAAAGFLVSLDLWQGQAEVEAADAKAGPTDCFLTLGLQGCSASASLCSVREGTPRASAYSPMSRPPRSATPNSRRSPHSAAPPAPAMAAAGNASTPLTHASFESVDLCCVCLEALLPTGRNAELAVPFLACIGHRLHLGCVAQLRAQARSPAELLCPLCSHSSCAACVPGLDGPTRRRTAPALCATRAPGA